MIALSPPLPVSETQSFKFRTLIERDWIVFSVVYRAVTVLSSQVIVLVSTEAGDRCGSALGSDAGNHLPYYLSSPWPSPLK